MHSASMSGSGMIQALTRALDLFRSGSSAFDDETNPREPPHEHPRNFSLSKGVPKPFVSKGNFE
jgi:hypothetical protein